MQDQSPDVPPNRLYQVVAAKLEAMILDGRFAEGNLLPAENALRELFGVGRITIREALLSLHQKGLIRIRNGERSRVTAPSAARLIEMLSSSAQVYLSREEGVRHFQGLRSLFELAVVRLAATSATEEDLALLRSRLRLNEEALDDADAFAQADVAFHLAIAEAAHNPLISGIYRALGEWLTEQRRIVLEGPPVQAAALNEHAMILDAIEARDPDASERAMRAHLHQVQARYWAVAGSRPDEQASADAGLS